MENVTTQAAIPSRILYTMVRVADLDRSVAFYQHILGMQEFRREDFSEGRFTLVFMGYGDELSNTVIELTHNWDPKSYQHGTRYGHVALEVCDIYGACQRLEEQGVVVLRKPGPMSYAVDETGHRETIAFIEDPDGYKIELVQSPDRTGHGID